MTVIYWEKNKIIEILHENTRRIAVYKSIQDTLKDERSNSLVNFKPISGQREDKQGSGSNLVGEE